MTISTRNPVVIKTRRKQHTFTVQPLSSCAFIGQMYAEILWSNRPEKKDGSG
jgi:hypothetical protein